MDMFDTQFFLLLLSIWLIVSVEQFLIRVIAARAPYLFTDPESASYTEFRHTNIYVYDFPRPLSSLVREPRRGLSDKAEVKTKANEIHLAQKPAVRPGKERHLPSEVLVFASHRFLKKNNFLR